MDLKFQLQHTDIYLIDQILKGRFENIKSVLDVGCGKGRNITYFLENGLDVYGLDIDANCINYLIEKKQLQSSHFKVGEAENIPFNQSFDLIICNAVLHFAKNKAHFEEMLFSIWNKLNDNGVLFIRLASDIGIEHLVQALGSGNFKLPDNTTRYLVNKKSLLAYSKQLNATLIEPIKTTNVQSLRCMTTWILKK